MSDIDIEVREVWWCEAEQLARIVKPTVPWGSHECDPDMGCGWRFLMSLADQDGELWMEKRCKHGELEWHKTFGKTWENGVCPGGSRVRVWPKAAE